MGAAAVLVLGALGLLLWPILRTGERARAARGTVSVTPADAELGGALPIPAPDVPATPQALRAESSPAPEPGESGARLEVRVFDALFGSPLNGARVTLHDRADPVPRLTDAHGLCAVPQLDPERESLLTVEHADHVSFRWRGDWRGAATVRLDPAFRLEARVVAADTGEPVPGARVEFTRSTCNECEPEAVTSGADGGFAIDGLARECVQLLTLTADGFASLDRPFLVRHGAPQRVHEIRLPRGARVFGEVVDALSLEGIPEARVGGLKCNADGRFDGFVQPLAGGQRVVLRVAAPGHVDLVVREASAVFSAEQRFALPRPAWIEGNVRARDGAPVAHATLQFSPGWPAKDEQGERVESTPLYELPEAWFYELEPNHVEADAGGHFRLGVLPWALNGTLRVHADTCDSEERPWKLTGLPGETQRLDLTLTPSRDGPVLSGAVLLNGERWALEGSVTWRGTAEGSVRLEQNGTFSSAVVPGEFAVVAELDALPGVRSAPVNVRLGPHSVLAVYPDVRVPELTITGRVSHPDGSPAVGIALDARTSVPRRFQGALRLGSATRSDAEGRYVLRVIDFGLVYEVTCRVPGGDDLVATATPGAESIDFVVPRAAVLRVRVRDGRTGEVLARDVGYQLLVGGERRFFSRVVPLSDSADPGGYTEVPLLEERVDLLALPRLEVFPTLAPALELGVAPFASDEPIELVLQPGVTLELELAPDALRPDARHELYLVEESLWSSIWRSDWDNDGPMAEFAQRRRVVFDERGRASVEALAAGPVRFKIFPDDLLVTPASFRLDPGQPPVEVTWSNR